MTTINTESAAPLIEQAASEVIACAKSSGVEKASAAGDVQRHAAALRDLGLTVDDAVGRIVNEATASQRFDVDGFPMFPEPHELDGFVRGILDALIEPRSSGKAWRYA